MSLENQPEGHAAEQPLEEEPVQEEHTAEPEEKQEAEEAQEPNDEPDSSVGLFSGGRLD